MRPLVVPSLLLCMLAGCAPRAGHVEVRSADVPAAHVEEEPAVAISVRAPAHARYMPSILGAPRPRLALTVTNRGLRPLDVANLRVHLAVEHAGVSFPCEPDPGPRAREPSSLEPGATFAFERRVDCALPLAGLYTVRVGVSFGRGAWSSGRVVDRFTLSVTAPTSVQPRPIGATGLWASAGATPVAASSTGRGQARIAIAIVNASPGALDVPRLRIATRVRKSGATFACEDTPVELDPPSPLAAGATHREPLELSCVGLGAAGVYAVEIRLLVEGAPDVPLGTVRVEVTRDPSVVDPQQWPR